MYQRKLSRKLLTPVIVIVHVYVIVVFPFSILVRCLIETDEDRFPNSNELHTALRGVRDGVMGATKAADSILTSSSVSSTSANSPSKIRSAACITSLYRRRAA